MWLLSLVDPNFVCANIAAVIVLLLLVGLGADGTDGTDGTEEMGAEPIWNAAGCPLIALNVLSEFHGKEAEAQTGSR